VPQAVTGDSVVKFWRLKGGGLLHRFLLGRDIGMMRLQVAACTALHYCAIALHLQCIYSALQCSAPAEGERAAEDFVLVLVDFRHPDRRPLSAALTDIAFSADSRWLVSSQIPFAVKYDLCTD
jgi:hypothetical protein